MAMAMRNSSRYLFSGSTDAVCGNVTAISFLGSVKYVQTVSRKSATGSTLEGVENPSSISVLKHRKVIPYSKPVSSKDVNRLYEFFNKSTKLVTLTGAGISTECGIPDYRSPNGAYSTGFQPMTHQEFLGSSRAQKRYWVKNYPVWRKFQEAKPGPAHIALKSLEKANRINFMITQNIDRLHHRAGSSPLELHGTDHTVVCVKCGFSFRQELFQDQLKSLNPKWEAAIDSLANDSNSNKRFGMKQRPDGDIEINEKFWKEDFNIPTCRKCKGVLKPNVVFYGDDIPKHKVKIATEAAKGCDAFLVLGSSLTTMFALQLVRQARDIGAAIGIINIGTTQADCFADLKINGQIGEILPQILDRLT